MYFVHSWHGFKSIMMYKSCIVSKALGGIIWAITTQGIPYTSSATGSTKSLSLGSGLLHAATFLGGHHQHHVKPTTT